MPTSFLAVRGNVLERPAVEAICSLLRKCSLLQANQSLLSHSLLTANRESYSSPSVAILGVTRARVEPGSAGPDADAL